MPKRSDFAYVIGVDEVGRGPIAGPVTVGVVAAPSSFSRAFFRGIRDSKKLSGSMREMWFGKAREVAQEGELLFSVSSVGPTSVDNRGIVWSVRRALARALTRLPVEPEACLVLLDGGLRAPHRFPYQKTIIRGEEKEPLIALASVIAKVHRDRKMTRLADTYPGYGFEFHKGYGTKQHYRCLRRQGLCELHRRSFLRRLI